MVLWTFEWLSDEKFAVFGMFLLFAPLVAQCGQSKKGDAKSPTVSSRQSEKKASSKAPPPPRPAAPVENVEKPSPSDQPNAAEKKKTNSKASKKSKTSKKESKKSKKSAKNSNKSKKAGEVQKEGSVKKVEQPKQDVAPPVKDPSVKKMKTKEWQPPPEAERPKHPGVEAPVDPSDEHKTLHQIASFPDAQDFV